MKNMYLLLGLGSFCVLLVMLVMLALFFRRRLREAGVGVKLQRQSGFALESAALKIVTPPDLSMELLPGRLEVAGTDRTLATLRFYQSPGRAPTRISFGRSPARDHHHVELKSTRVEPLHAELVWSNHCFTLVNYSLMAPTRVNGRALSKNGSVPLSEGDRIEMGESMFIFHQC